MSELSQLLDNIKTADSIEKAFDMTVDAFELTIERILTLENRPRLSTNIQYKAGIRENAEGIDKLFRRVEVCDNIFIDQGKRIAALESPTPAEPQAITDEEVAKLEPGFYIIYFPNRASFYCAVGTNEVKARWWVAVAGTGYQSTDWSNISHVERISVE